MDKKESKQDGCLKELLTECDDEPAIIDVYWADDPDEDEKRVLCFLIAEYTDSIKKLKQKYEHLKEVHWHNPSTEVSDDQEITNLSPEQATRLNDEWKKTPTWELLKYPDVTSVSMQMNTSGEIVCIAYLKSLRYNSRRTHKIPNKIGDYRVVFKQLIPVPK